MECCVRYILKLNEIRLGAIALESELGQHLVQKRQWKVETWLMWYGHVDEKAVDYVVESIDQIEGSQIKEAEVEGLEKLLQINY